jgi:hypothetical protein
MGFQDGRCGLCGYEEAPVYELPIEALDEIEPLDLGAIEDPGPLELEHSELSEPVPLVEGFEGTMIEERARPRRKDAAKPKKESAPFVHRVCPSCAATVPEPNPTFCEACGYKLVSKRKTAAAEEATKRCGDCGTKNAPDRGICRNCGSRLPSRED